MKGPTDCCHSHNPAGTGELCTVPKNITHAECENWWHWGSWSGDPLACLEPGEIPKPGFKPKFNCKWPNPNVAPPSIYKKPKLDKTNDYSTWIDEVDCLPDA